MRNLIIIDGTPYSCPILSMDRKADTLYKYAERTEDGNLHSERIGWYRNYRIEVGFLTDHAAYQALYNKLTEPDEFHMVSLPDTVGMTPSYEAYFADISDRLQRVKGNTQYWHGLGFDVIARRPYRT